MSRAEASMLWVTANNLERWADRLDCQSKFPAVVRRVIHGSGVPIREVDFPAGDSVILPGFDGYLEAGEGSPFVPSGLSVWEFGTSSDIGSKANADYKKRSEKEQPFDKASATFVFATPRRWPKKDDWRRAKLAERKWRDIRAYDADNIEQWLEQVEPAAVWTAEQVGDLPTGILHSLEWEWERWRSQTRPASTEQLLIAGRADQVGAFLSLLRDGSGVLTIKAQSPDEALAFAAATILTAGEPRASLLARSVAVAVGAESLSRLRHMRGRILLMPDSAAARAEAPALAACGNHVVLGVGNEAPGARVTVELARAPHHEFVEALIGMDLPEEEAERIALECNRSPTVLRRRRPSATFTRPAWADAGSATALLPAMLAGGWDERNEADKRVLGALAGQGYDDWSSTVVRWCHAPDPPVRRVESVWQVVAPADACELLAPYLTTRALDAFAVAVIEVLGEIDPQFELPPDERVFAAVRGRSLTHSEWLRRGVARTLLLLGARQFDRLSAGTVDARPRVEAIVGRLLAVPGWLPWASLGGHLPLLAEAAPDPFLSALEQRLEGAAGREFASIFSEGGGFLGGSSPHTGVLWALETLAWDPKHLRRACLALARLAVIDPGGKLANRPFNSLQKILLPWHPGTNANARLRLSALDAVLSVEPEVGWKLLAALLPERGGGFAVNTAKPAWRDAGEAGREVVTYGIAGAFRQDVVARLLTRIEDDPGRWATLFDKLSKAFSPDDRAKVVATLRTFAEGQASPSAKEAVWHRGRAFIGTHRSFADADWTLEERELTDIEAAISGLRPTDLVERSAWLFDDYYPKLPTRLDHRGQRRDEIATERCRAVREIYARAGEGGLVRLAERVKYPGLVATSVADTFSEEAIERVVRAARNGGEHARLLTSVLSGQADRQFAGAWRDRLLARAAAEGWPPDELANCLLRFPDEPVTWDLAQSLGEEARRVYWASKPAFPLDDLPATDRARALTEFAAVGRVLEAVGVASHSADGLAPALLIDLLQRALAETVERSAHRHLANLRYEINIVFDGLRENPGVDETALARLEYLYLPLLDDQEGHKPWTIHKALSDNPSFFVEVLTHVYKRAGAESDDLPDEDRERVSRRAEMGWQLLQSWERVPGTLDDGTIDPERLLGWMRRARELAAQEGRTAVGDLQIGQTLAHAPADADGAWPHRAVRRVLEEFDISDIDRGLLIERHNMRGAFWRDKGGSQERKLAAENRRWAKIVQGDWPRTALVLEAIAESWERDAQREDVRQAQDDLR